MITNFFKRMKIECFKGDEEKLYQKVAHLVMDPKVLKENNNYPFKTSENYRWFVASVKRKVVGFMPVEYKNGYMVLNNYVYGKDEQVLDALIKAVIQKYEEEEMEMDMLAVVQRCDMDVFQRNDFGIVKEWKLYVKMEWKGQ